MRLSPLVAGATSAAILAGASVWIFSFLIGWHVWAAFIGWASYDQSGADRKALVTSSSCMVFGTVMAWLVALVVAGHLVPPPAASGSSAVAAAIASFIIVYTSRLFALSNVPATFYGFASSFAFLLLSNGAFTMRNLTSLSLRNVIVCVPLSLLTGSLLGIVHQQFASLLTAPVRRTTGGAIRLTPPG